MEYSSRRRCAGNVVIGIMLVFVMLVMSGVYVPQAWAASSKPSAVFESELNEAGDQLFVTFSLREATFNAVQFRLVYDESKLRISSYKTNEEIEGTMKGAALGRNGSPIESLAGFYTSGAKSRILDAGTFAGGSSAGEGEVKVLLSVDQSTTNADRVKSDGGGVFVDTGHQLELIRISFRVKAGTSKAAALQSISTDQVAGVWQEAELYNRNSTGGGIDGADGSGSGGDQNSTGGSGDGGQGGTGGSGDGGQGGTGGSGDGGSGQGGTDDGTGSGGTGGGTGGGTEEPTEPKPENPFTKRTLKIEGDGKSTGFVLSTMNEKGGIIGYRDPALVEIELPGLGGINQGDGKDYDDVILDGGSGDGTGGNNGGGSGGNTEIVDAPDILDKITSSGNDAGEEAAGETAEENKAAAADEQKEQEADLAKEPYYDIKGHWAESSMRTLIEKQILSGYPEGSVKPNDGMTRAEFCVVLSKILGLEPLSAGNDFADASTHWARGYIGAITQKGIAIGTGNDGFTPNEKISRQELAVMVAGAFDLSESGQTAAAGEPFTDADKIAPWAKSAVEQVKKAGIIKGYPEGSFQPEKHVTRAEISVVAQQLLTRQNENAGL